MAALAVIGTTLLQPDMAPLSIRTGANSKSDPNAGVTTGVALPGGNTDPITVADRVGATILTVLVCAFFLGGAFWLVK